MNCVSKALFVLSIIFVLRIQARQELITCSDKGKSSKISLEFDSENRSFVISGQTLRTAKPGDRGTMYKFDETFPIYSDSSIYAFPGYDLRGGDVCKALSLSMIDPENTDWKKCQEGFSQLEWMGKYSGGKAGIKNKESDKKLEKYLDVILSYCPKFDGKLSEVWVSIPNGEKPCDRVGISVGEFAKPMLYSSHHRLESLFQNSLSVTCKYDVKSINNLANDLKTR